MEKIKIAVKMKFYTGLFNKIFRFIQPFLSDLIYWKGQKHAKKFSKFRHPRCNALRKLSQRDEIFLTLMHFGSFAERFGVSLWSYIFTTWIKLLSKILGKALVVWPPKEFIKEHLPGIFLKSGCGKRCVIIDCAELFTE